MGGDWRYEFVKEGVRGGELVDDDQRGDSCDVFVVLSGDGNKDCVPSGRDPICRLSLLDIPGNSSVRARSSGSHIQIKSLSRSHNSTPLQSNSFGCQYASS